VNPAAGPEDFLLLMKSSVVMRGLDPRIHHLGKKDGLPGQARQ
jgi:hypothetical protein